MSKFRVEWIDRKLEPKGTSDPAYPDGIDIDLTQGQPGCSVTLPYPARRIGYFFVECKSCRKNALITTAGRRDDPRSLKLACAKTSRVLQ